MEWPGRVYAQQMHYDFKKPGLELHFAICPYEVTLLRRLLTSPPPEPEPEEEGLKRLNLPIGCTKFLRETVNMSPDGRPSEEMRKGVPVEGAPKV